MSLQHLGLPTALVLASAACIGAAQDAPTPSGVPTPDEHLGRPLGVDFELADWDEVRSYYARLAEASPHVLLERVGQTTEGRDFLMATLSSEANLARLDAIRADSARIADPRGLGEPERERLLDEGVPVLLISIAMHSTETAGPQFGMEFAWRLATSQEEPWRSAREKLVVVMFPCLNPDGLDHVVSWYRETVGTPYEASSLLKLYQYYTGHDNNRDWFMLSQAETRLVTEQLYSVWRPQVYWDVHQQGTTRERFFVPPFRDPLNPNLDPSVIAGIDALGSRALFDMTRDGKTGVSTGVTYDMWWNGGNRNVPVRHNIIGLLTEAASVDVASPVFLPLRELSAPRGLGGYAPSNRFPAPWPGGWWRLRDIIDYELSFGRSLLASLAREPRAWLENSLEAAERAITAGVEDAPRAWVLPSDNADLAALERLVDALQRSGVEIGVAAEAFEADGRSWPAKSLVIRRAQPYGAYVKDLFEVQRYPEGDAPYDVAGWTLPLLLGVRRVELMTDPEVELEPLERDASLATLFGRAASSRGPGLASDGGAWKRSIAALYEGEELRLGSEAEGALERGGPIEGALALTPRRIGLYAPWSGSMDEGWTRWLLDEWGVPYARVRNEMIRAGDLASFLDVLVIPSLSGYQLDRGRSAGSVPDEFVGGLDPEGAVAVEEFVRAGGRLVTLGSSSAWAIELFELDLEDATDSHDEFSCPGSVLRSIPTEDPWSAGLPASLPLFFSRSAGWELEETDTLKVLLRYAESRVLLSGWIRGAEAIEGQAAWVRASVGEGDVVLFAFRPHYRSWSQATFQLVFRSLFLEAPE